MRDGDGPRFLVKGGISIEIRLGLAARATKDIDVVFRGNPDQLRDALDEAFAMPYAGFDFRRKTTPEPIHETASHRFEVQVSFRGKSWETIQVEAAGPEVDEVELVPVAIDLADFTLDGPEEVACLSLRFQIAQKLHAVTERPTDGRVNHRYWDLIDLILLRPLMQDPAAVRAACREVFEARGTHGWPPNLDVVERWREPYRADVARLGVELPTDLDEGVQAVRRFIVEIDHAGSSAELSDLGP